MINCTKFAWNTGIWQINKQEQGKKAQNVKSKQRKTVLKQNQTSDGRIGTRKNLEIKSYIRLNIFNSGDAEMEAFLTKELGGKVSSESDVSDGETKGLDKKKHGTCRVLKTIFWFLMVTPLEMQEFYALKGEKKERLAATLSEEDASSDEFDSENLKRQRGIEENGKPPRGK